MARTLWFLFETLGSLLVSACVLRALAWRVQLSPRNPIGQFLIAATEWLVRPLRKVVPSSRTTDWASICAAIVVALVLAVVWTVIFAGARPPAFGGVLLLALYWVLKWSLYLLIAMVILQAVLSWVNPRAPIAPALDQLTRPFLAPLRRVVPLVGGVDLSPLVLIILLQVVISVLESLFVAIVAIP